MNTGTPTKSLSFMPLIVFGIVALAILSTVFGSWYTIDQGERGVILRYGAIAGTAEPGLGFKLPVIDSIVRISVQSKAAVYDAMEAYSRDQQPATVKLSVNYRIPVDRVATVYEQYGSEAGLLGRLIERRVFEETKTVFGRFNAVTAIQERGRLNQEIAVAIQEGVQGPVIIESVQIENIDFSDSYEESIEQRMLAEVEVQKLRQNAEREKVQAEITVTQANANADARRADAQAQADAVRLQAQAEAEAIKLRGDAEALAIKARGDALRNNPGLVSLTQAEKWDGRLPTTMLPNGALPMIDLRNQGLPDAEQTGLQ